jgi:transposase
MDRDCFWLDDRQFARLEPHLPTDTRGKPRGDDRRVISGIVHVLKSGCRWIDAAAVYGLRKTLCNRFVRWAAKGIWVGIFHALASTGGPPAEVIHALTDRFCRPVALLPTGGQVADCTAADTLLDPMSVAEILHGDKGYDSDAVRRKIESKGAAPNIPPKANRRWKNCFSPRLYRNRNAIERMFGRLKDLRRIATRYHRLAHNFLAAVGLADTLCYWL